MTPLGWFWIALCLSVLTAAIVYPLIRRRRRQRAAQEAVALALWGLIDPWQRQLWWLNLGFVKFARGVGEALTTALAPLARWVAANHELIEALADDDVDRSRV